MYFVLNFQTLQKLKHSINPQRSLQDKHSKEKFKANCIMSIYTVSHHIDQWFSTGCNAKMRCWGGSHHLLSLMSFQTHKTFNHVRNINEDIFDILSSLFLIKINMAEKTLTIYFVIDIKRCASNQLYNIMVQIHLWLCRGQSLFYSEQSVWF